MSSEYDALLNRIQTMEAKFFAMEAVIIHVMAPILMQAPGPSLKVIEVMRHDLKISAQPGREHFKLIAEEHINDIADRLERKLRSKEDPK